jgi:hypothetical protein
MMMMMVMMMMMTVVVLLMMMMPVVLIMLKQPSLSPASSAPCVNPILLHQNPLFLNAPRIRFLRFLNDPAYRRLVEALEVLALLDLGQLRHELLHVLELHSNIVVVVIIIIIIIIIIIPIIIIIKTIVRSSFASFASAAASSLSLSSSSYHHPIILVLTFLVTATDSPLGSCSTSSKVDLSTFDLFFFPSIRS